VKVKGVGLAEARVRSSLLWKRVLRDGLLLNVLITVLVYGSIWVNPLVHVGDYPPDIKAAVGDVDVPAVQGVVEALLCLALVIAIGLWSNAKLRQELGGRLSFWWAFANSALIMLFFAVWDLLVLDWLVFVTIQPSFIVIPGTEGLAGYRDYFFHFKVSFLGWVQWVSILAGGLVLAAISSLGARLPRGMGRGRSGVPVEEETQVSRN